MIGAQNVVVVALDCCELVDRCGWLWVVVAGFGSSLFVGSLWGRCWVVVGSLWGRCGSLWGRCGVVVGSLWGRCGVVVGSLWGRCVSLWGRCGVVVGRCGSLHVSVTTHTGHYINLYQCGSQAGLGRIIYHFLADTILLF